MMCIFRRIECKLPNRRCANDVCICCLSGQQIDSIELLTNVIMDLKIDALEEEAYELTKV